MPAPVLMVLAALMLALQLNACAGAEPPRPRDSHATNGPLAVEDLLAPELSGTGGELVALAQQQLGRPYRYGGNSPSGFDCSGLVHYVHREAGFVVPRTSTEQYRQARKVSLAGLAPGDLLFFRISAQKISHVGIYVSNDLFIHSPSSGKGVSYASLDEAYWTERLVGAGRFY